MRCLICGHDNSDDSIFCIYCGHKIGSNLPKDQLEERPEGDGDYTIPLYPPEPIRVYRVDPKTGSWSEEYITDPDEIEAFKSNKGKKRRE